MRFEARELKPYAEPVTADELKEGEIYFFVTFLDGKLLIPQMEPMVFIGRDLNEEDEGRVYFQDVGSFRDGIRYGEKDPDVTFRSGAANQVKHIFTFEKGLDVLLECSLRRSREDPRHRTGRQS